MLKEYKKKHAKLLSQNLIVSAVGKILESDNTFFNATSYNNLEDIHPFFMSLTGLLNTKGEEFVFSCVHLYLNDEEKITDIFLKTFKDDKSPLLIIQDLTGHYKSYQDTAQTRNESIISKQALALHNDYLSERESFKNTFIANFSHELRDPLTGILTFSNILKKTDLNEEQSNYLEVLRSSTNYLKKMIDDILDISKIEAGKLDLILEPFDILALLNELKVVYTAKAKNKGLNFTYDFNENLPKIIGGDVLRLRQVLTSLLDNAIKFTEKGTVNLSVSLNQIRAQKASIHFKITDTGIGISEEELENIFNSFTQVNNPQSFKGNGLGLAISQYLVGLTNSTIKVKSEVGKGSTFSTNINFALDLSKSVAKKEETKSRKIRHKKYNILLVEDSEITQLSVLKILASQGHFFLDIISNANQVVEKIENSDFDLLLLDIKIHDQYGDELAQIIRKLPEREHKRIPIIALTAKVFKEDLRRYKKAGINHIVKKPFEEDTLLDAIDEYLK